MFLPTSTLEKFQIAQLGDVNLRTIHEDRDANECLNPETSATNAVGSFANIFFFHTKYDLWRLADNSAEISTWGLLRVDLETNVH